jgi:hypothetical protein
MTSEKRTKIVELIAKLKRLSVDNPNKEEAALAAARMQELATKYKIEQAEILDAEEDKLEINQHEFYTEKGIRFSRWKLTIAYRLAKINGCAAIRSQGYEYKNIKVKELAKVIIVGTEEAVQIVKYMFAYIVREIERLSQIALKKYNEELGQFGKGGKSYANAFKVGAADAVVSRLNNQRWNIIKHNENALAVIDKEYNESVEWMERNFAIKKAPCSVRATSHEGYSDGRNAGSKIGLGGGKGLQRGPKALTSG